MMSESGQGCRLYERPGDSELSVTRPASEPPWFRRCAAAAHGGRRRCHRDWQAAATSQNPEPRSREIGPRIFGQPT